MGRHILVRRLDETPSVEVDGLRRVLAVADIATLDIHLPITGSVS